VKPARRESALDRFLRYVRIDTQSAEDVAQVPSTRKQLDLARLLVKELKALGIKRVTLDAHGYVMATIPANLPRDHLARGKVPRVGLIAHLDTSPSASGAGVKPQVLTYRGGDLRLPGNPEVVIRVRENPELKGQVGKTIVTSDGTTLLGADDKAGIAAIMTLAEQLCAPDAPLHGDVQVAFTPDEEVGRGTAFFDLARFGADVAYTFDGGTVGELNKETFSADGATITVTGRNIHPGEAKGVMVNALRVLADVIVRLPRDLSPERTEGHQGFIHPHTASGEEAQASVKLLLRDFDEAGLKSQRKLLEAILKEVRPLHPGARVELEVKPSYRNMRDRLAAVPEVADALEEATRRAGVKPRWVPIRGGTDGSRLTAMGLPTPNVFAGGHNFHGPTEWLAVEGMEKVVLVARHLLAVWVEVGVKRKPGGR
jgi:tripeptide aminopeptidase